MRRACPPGMLVGFDAPALNDNDEMAFVATVRRGRDTLDVLYFWNGRRLQRVVAEGDLLLRIGGTMDKIGEPALNNSGVDRLSGGDPQRPGARRHFRCRRAHPFARLSAQATGRRAAR